MKTFRCLPVLLFGLCLGLPLTGFCERRIIVQRSIEVDRGFHQIGYQPRYYRNYSAAYRPYEMPRMTGELRYVRPPDYPVIQPCGCGRAHPSARPNELALDLQNKLRYLGYYRGFPDGVIGPRTRDAIRAYQAELGLRQTGLVDLRLLQALGLAT